MGVFPERFVCWGKHRHECECYQPGGWGPRLKKSQAKCQHSPCLAFCRLRQRPLTLCPCSLTSAPPQTVSFLIVSSSKPFSWKLLPVMYFAHMNRSEYLTNFGLLRWFTEQRHLLLRLTSQVWSQDPQDWGRRLIPVSILWFPHACPRMCHSTHK